MSLASTRPTCLFVVWALSCVLAATGCEEDRKGKATDEPCESQDECRGTQPSCVDLGDGVTRCQSMCLQDADCPEGANCIFAEGDIPDEGTTPGVCWRRCSDLEDCASGSWSCEPILADSEQGYCVLILD